MPPRLPTVVDCCCLLLTESFVIGKMEVLDPSSSLTLRQALCTWTSGGSFLRASAILLPWASKLFLLYVGGTLKSERVSFLSPNGNRCVRASLQDSVPKLSPCLIPGYRWLPPLLILSSSALSLGPVVKGFLQTAYARHLVQNFLCGQEVSCYSFRDRWLFVCTCPSATAA